MFSQLKIQTIIIFFFLIGIMFILPISNSFAVVMPVFKQSILVPDMSDGGDGEKGEVT